MRYKVGDRVVIVSKRIGNFNPEGYMDHWLGSTMTVRSVIDNYYGMKEDITERCWYGWFWCDYMIDHEATERLRQQTIEEFREQEQADTFKEKFPDIKRVLLNKKQGRYYTTVILKDGRKSVVSKHKDDEHNWELGMLYAYNNCLRQEAPRPRISITKTTPVLDDLSPRIIEECVKRMDKQLSTFGYARNFEKRHSLL